MALSNLTIGVVCCVVVAIVALVTRKQPDAREPPYVKEAIPYFSHIYGLLKHGLRYFDLVSAQQPHPIFTIDMSGQKNYIVTSPELVQAVQRNTTSLSFSPAMIPAFRRMMGFDEAGIELIFRDAHTENGMYGEIHRVQKASLLPGTESLDELCTLIRAKLLSIVNELSSSQTIDLYAWVQDLFMRTNNSACFGEKDPFTLDPSLNSTFWAWEANIKVLLLGVPWFLSPKKHSTAQRTRKELVDAFIKYLNNDGLDTACSFIKELSGLGIRRGLSNENNARALLGSILAIVGNTIPTTFWLLISIFSRPDLLKEIRSELEATLEDSSSRTMSLDYNTIREKCTVFMSTYDEVLRMTSGIATVRYTNEDTLIQDRWLLKKGAQVQMPTAFIHADPTTWGTDADVFDHTRFLKSKVLTKEQKTRRAAAFRPFGGGNTLCPGRHFASYEVLTFAGSVLLGFDMAPTTKSFDVPQMDRSKLPLTSLKPASDIKVELLRRPGWGEARFR
ncbi:cholesterol 7-alpha-monooxygenase [Fusarium mexicanum]|uniref:Cholesterol 7-alpha-monooxygenase n=1 Tax=Fusarium mexicanum TaxID=751941 RepID=A0A8H5MLA7_9HYPO|nr:cholesterol 7-alpha-monooxygenase [Fusarium mexicanum]